MDTDLLTEPGSYLPPVVSLSELLERLMHFLSIQNVIEDEHGMEDECLEQKCVVEVRQINDLVCVHLWQCGSLAPGHDGHCATGAV